MGHKPFKKPLFLKLNGSWNYQARSVWEALEYMDRFWPAEHTPLFTRARQLCRDALDGLISDETARLAVADAARRAGALQRSWKPASVANSRFASPPTQANGSLAMSGFETQPLR